METGHSAYQSKSVRLTEQLLHDFSEGSWMHDLFLPPEEQLMKHYEVSRHTLRRALEVLQGNESLTRLPDNRMTINRSVSIPEPAAGKAQYTIAWVYAAEQDTLICNLTEGIRRYAAQHNFDLRLIHSNIGYQPVMQAIANSRALGIDGVIFIPLNHEGYLQTIESWQRDHFPAVSVFPYHLSEVSTVTGDDFGGAVAAVSHLLERHNRPVYLLISQNDDTAEVRCDGYMQAMIDHGFSDEIESHVLRLNVDGTNPAYWSARGKIEQPMAVIEAHFDQLKLPASIVCENDYFAFALYRIAEKRGLVIGRDLHIVGFGDLPMGRRLKPALTSVRVDSRQNGYLAAEVLHRIITGELKGNVHLMMPAELMIRKSS